MSRTVFHNARLLSFHDGFRPGKADTLVQENGRITALGSWEELHTLAGPGTERIDCGGHTLLPGFHDTHIHLWKVGNLQTFMLDLRNTESLDEMLSLLAQYRQQYPEAPWITARGFNEGRWKEGRMPDRHDLDKVIPDKPVYVIRTCAHIAAGNSRAMEIAGITAATQPPPGGVIYRDAAGQPSGLLAETALGLITAHIPPYSKEQLKTMIRSVREDLYRYGITAASDPAVDPLLLEAYYELEAAGDLGFRLQAIPILLPDGGAEPYPIPQVYHSEYFTVNTVKFFSDGGLSGRTAALTRDYPGDPGSRGILRLDPDQYLALARQAQEQGLGIATHAIGDAAIGQVTGIYRQLRRSFPNALCRIEHLGLPSKQHLEDMAAYDIATSMQTIFLTELGRNFRQALDDVYLERCYPVHSALQHSILVALSSDAPVVRDFNPLAGMRAAITRKDSDGVPISPGESIPVEDALKAYTQSAARISGLPDLGSLEPGKVADLILLDRDPLTTPAEELTNTKVLSTWVGGKQVYMNQLLRPLF